MRPPGCPILRLLLPALLLVVVARAASPADDAARVWLARAVLASERGDDVEVARALAWVGRLDAGPEATLAIARVRLARGEVDAVALDVLVRAAVARPALWPEAYDAAVRHGRAAEVLERWAAAAIPDVQREARGRALADAGRATEAATDLAAAMRWVPRPDLLAAWAAQAEASGRLDEVVDWTRRTGAAGFGPAWSPALAIVAAADARSRAPR